MPKVSSSATTSSDPDAASATKTERHDINYYRSSADDDAAVLEELRQRQREEAQRKKELKKFHKQFGYWNPYAPYKADRPTNLEAYRASGGYRRKQEGFNDFLRSMRRDNGEVSINSKPVSSSSSTSTPPSFATKPSFAPPASYDPPTMSREQADEDPYLHRMRLSGQQSVAAPPPPPTPQTRSFPPPPTGSDDAPPPPPPPPPQALNADAPGTPAASSSVYHSATISAPPVRYANATISAPPVRYEQPPARPSKDESNISERPAKRVKTMTTAEKIMLKMGHKEGQGLGKNNDGITTALEVKKRKSAPGGQSGILDDGAGQKVRSAQVWDVSGGQRKKDEPGKFGEESPVVVTWGCVEGVDWKENAERNDGGIRQEMGEAFSTKVCLGKIHSYRTRLTSDSSVRSSACMWTSRTQKVWCTSTSSRS